MEERKGHEWGGSCVLEAGMEVRYMVEGEGQRKWKEAQGTGKSILGFRPALERQRQKKENGKVVPSCLRPEKGWQTQPDLRVPPKDCTGRPGIRGRKRTISHYRKRYST